MRTNIITQSVFFSCTGKLNGDTNPSAAVGVKYFRFVSRYSSPMFPSNEVTPCLSYHGSRLYYLLQAAIHRGFLPNDDV